MIQPRGKGEEYVRLSEMYLDAATEQKEVAEQQSHVIARAEQFLNTAIEELFRWVPEAGAAYFHFIYSLAGASKGS